MSGIALGVLVALLAIGGSVAAHRWIRRRGDGGYRGAFADALLRFLPGVVVELGRQRRLSYWVPTAPGGVAQRVWGYADRHSVRPGEAFGLRLSTRPDDPGGAGGHVEVRRAGSSDVLWRSGRLEVRAEVTGLGAAAVGAGWPRALEISDTSDWRSGYYSIDFVEDGGRRDEEVAFLVVTDREPGGDVLVKLSTHAYQAYNRWGGHSLYHWESSETYEGRPLAPFEREPFEGRGDVVSFDRPTPSEFWEWECYFADWIEELARERGLSVGYATNHDLESDPAWASAYGLLVSAGHDEYWSRAEFEHVWERIFRHGKSAMFLGANSAYWQVRTNYSGATRQLACYRASERDPIATAAGADPLLDPSARHRDGARRPETMLLGVGYESNLPFRRQLEPAYDYRVEDADLPFFRGTGYHRGDSVGPLIGHEWDRRDPEAEFAAPGEQPVEAEERLWHPTHSRIPKLESERIHTVLSGEAVDVLGRRGRAEAVYYESPAGARVFSSGTNRWNWGLGRPGFESEAFRRLNRNLVLHLLALDCDAEAD